MKNKLLFLVFVSYNILFLNITQAEPVLVGQGDMRWFGLHLYEIELYTETGRYEVDQPLELIIRYQLKIDRDKLISISENEVVKMGNQWRPEWTEQLESIWPTVIKDDVLTLSVNLEGSSSFYYNGKLRGRIADPKFGKNFTAIWLSPETRESKLRKKLIGA
jgi:hypothetical protein